MIGARKFERQLEYLNRTGVPQELELRLRSGPGGRPRAIAVATLLAGIMLTSETRQSVVFTRVHRLLTTDLDRRLQTRLGIRDAHGQPITIRQVRYLFNAIVDVLDHSPAYRPDLSELERAQRADAFQKILDRLSGAASQHLNNTGVLGIDATPVHSAARGRLGNRQIDAAEARGESDESRVRCADLDGRWGYQTKTYNKRSNLMFGYQLITHTRLGTVGAPKEPMLIERIAFAPGNTNGVPEALEIIDALARDDRPVHEVVVDRGLSYATAENWAIPLRDRGVSQVMDYHPNDRGKRPHADGYVMIDGQPFCPSIPEHLVRIERPAHLSPGTLPKHPTKEDKLSHEQRVAAIKTFQNLVAERETYRFAPVGKTTAGTARFRCPARAGKISCAGCPFSMDLPAGTPQVEPADLAHLPKACRQETITIKTDVDLKRRQPIDWGTPEWIRSYGRRSRSEGGHGILRSPERGGIRRGFTRVVGLTKTGLLIALVVAQENLTSLLQWAAETGDTRDPLVGIDVTHHGFVELDATGAVANDPGPPIAA